MGIIRIKVLLIMLTMTTGLSTHALWDIPTQEPSGHESFDTALTRLYQLYNLSECTSQMQSYEYIAPLISQSFEENPALYTDYFQSLPMNSMVSELHLKDLYEFQFAKSKVLNDGKADSEMALNKSTFRYIVPGEPIPRDLLQFTLQKKNDGSEKRFVRWVSNYEGMHEGEVTWLKRKKVFADWKVENYGPYTVVIIEDKENNESLTLKLDKRIVETGKPAQWVLTEENQGIQFMDYFTGFCDSVE